MPAGIGSRSWGTERVATHACLLGLMILAASACDGDRRSSLPVLAQVEAATPEFGSIAIEAPAEATTADERDRGIGIVFFDLETGPGMGRGADTLVILRDTVRRAVIARFILERDSLSWSFELESEEPLRSNALEFDYEVEGLPVLRPTSDGRWVVVIHGFAADGTARTGWVRVRPGTAKFRTWPLILRERDVFFVEGVKPEFFGSVRGTPVDFPLATSADVPGQLDYIMHPVQVQGEWMQVRVTSPSDMCASPGAVRQTLVWIRYLDERGRPRVWYYTRGC